MMDGKGKSVMEKESYFYFVFPLVIFSYIYVAANSETFSPVTPFLDIIYILPVTFLFAVSVKNIWQIRDRLFILLPLSCVLFSISEFLWVYYDIRNTLAPGQIPIWTELIYLAGYLLVIRYLHVKLSDLIFFRANLRHDIIDSLILGSLLTSLVVHFIISGSNPVQSEQAFLERMISFLYLLMDISIILTTLIYMFVTRSLKKRTPESLMAAAFFLMAIADSIYMILEWTGGYVTSKGFGLVSDVLWMSAYSILASTISYKNTFKKADFDHLYVDSKGEALRNRISTALPVVTFAAILFYGFQAFRLQNNFSQSNSSFPIRS